MDGWEMVETAFTTIKGPGGEITTDNPLVEGLLGAAALGVLAVGAYCVWKVCNDPKAAENIATVKKAGTE